MTDELEKTETAVDEPKRQTRKSWSKKAGKTQKMYSLRLDLDLLEWLNEHTDNKGFYINQAVREKIAADKKREEIREIMRH